MAVATHEQPAANGPRLRWWIAALLCAAITISYFDRQTLPLAVKEISKDIAIDDEKYAHLGTYFLATYGVMYVLGGRLLDWLGTRAGFFLIMIFWSFACASHGLAQPLGAALGTTPFMVLCMSRLLLGVGEGGGFPAATKAVAEWFPARERATAMGIINGGSALGGVLAPVLIVAVLDKARWPWVFYISGAFGLIWTLWWLRSYYSPAQHPRISSFERAELAHLLDAPSTPHGPAISWFSLLGYRQVWGLVLCKFLGDGVWYFISLWLPKYLMDARKFDTKDVRITSIAWLCAGIGCVTLGSLSSRLIGRGYTVNASRKIALAISVAVMPILMLVPRFSDMLVIVPFCVAYFGQQAWSTLVMTVPTDIFPRRVVGAVAGLVGFGGAMGGIAFGEMAGWMRSHNIGYGTIFFILGMMHVASFIVLMLFIPRIQPLEIEAFQEAVERRT